ncbi:MAG: hypothetical protein VB852_02610 [Deltaproteobacteria bacterium]
MKLTTLSLTLALALLACQSSPEPVDVVIPLPASVPAGSFVVIVDYSAAGASPKMDAGRPLCASILPREKKVRVTDDGQGRLRVSVTTPEALVAPLQIAACQMLPDAVASSGEDIGAALRVRLASSGTVTGKSHRNLPGTAAAPERVQAHDRQLEDEAPQVRPPGAPAARQAEGMTDPAKATHPWPDGGDSSPGPPDNVEGDRSVPASPAGQRSAPASGTPEYRADKAAQDRGLPPSATGQTSVRPGATSSERPGATSSERPSASASSGTAEDTVRPWDVTMGVTSGSGPVAALQFDVVYQGPSGSFVGRSQSVDCRVLVDVALSTGNNQRQGRLAYALIDLTGFDVPADVITCTFKTRDPLSTDSFTIKVVDATDSDDSPLKIGMAVTDVRRLD